MKFVLTQDEIKKIVSDHLQDSFTMENPFDVITSSYGDWECFEMTKDYLDAKTKHEAEMEVYRQKWAAEAKAKEEAEKAAAFAIDNAVTGNKS